MAGEITRGESDEPLPSLSGPSLFSIRTIKDFPCSRVSRDHGIVRPCIVRVFSISQVIFCFCDPLPNNFVPFRTFAHTEFFLHPRPHE